MSFLMSWAQRAWRRLFGHEGPGPAKAPVPEAAPIPVPKAFPTVAPTTVFEVNLKGEVHKREGMTVFIVPGRIAHPGWTEEYLRSRRYRFSQAELDRLDAEIERLWPTSEGDVPVAVFLERLDEGYEKVVDEAENEYKASVGIQ
jgi:hypothetical protein